MDLPTRRNKVWQMDFFELETSGGGTWRSGDVIDYATKLVLAGGVTATQTTPAQASHPHEQASSQTNGVIERYHDAIKIEALWRDLPAGGVEMTVMVDDFRPLYNPVRPYETLAGARPIERYSPTPTTRRQTTSTP